MSIRGKKLSIRIMVQTSLLIALAVVVRNFSYMVYFGGAPGMRIGFSGVFAKLIAMLFGPIIGGVASGIVDIIGFMIKPEGAYIPMLTITAILGGVISGVLWKIIKDLDTAKLQNAFIVSISIIGLLGVFNHIQMFCYSSSPWAQILQKLGKYKDFTSIGLEFVAIIGMIFLITGIIAKRTKSRLEMNNDFLKVLIATGFAGIFVATLNTYILQLFIPELGKIGFIVFWIPRVIQEVLMTVIQAYIISLLLTIYRKIIIK